MHYGWEWAHDFDDMIERTAPGTDAAPAKAAIEYVVDCLQDAVESVLSHYAKEIEHHYDYITSDAGVWERAEGGYDNDDFALFINRD